jgi:hypothetical protein
VSAKLPAIRSKYRLSELRLVVDGSDGEGETDHIVAAASPAKAGPTVRKRKAVNVGELVEQLWDEVVSRLAPNRGEKITKLSAKAGARAWTIMSELIGKAPFREGRPGASASVRERIDQATGTQAGPLDAKKVYSLLVTAARAVKDLYPRGALDLPIHHEERVSQHPATFLKDRAQRVKPQVQAQLEKELAGAKVPRKDFEEMVRSRLRDKLMDEIFSQEEKTRDKSSGLLEEVEMTPMPLLHGDVSPHGEVHEKERQEKQRQRRRKDEEAKGWYPS